MKNNLKGFTIIEVAVVIVILVILSGIIMFSVNRYIAKGKDSNVRGNLAVLVPGGEVYYNGNSNSYVGFCDPAQNSLLEKTFLNMPKNQSGSCFVDGTNPGVCCSAEENAWAACSIKFADSSTAFCVDSRGVIKDISSTYCHAGMDTVCP